MKDLSQQIEYLLLDHDCVIYPQLGAFVTTYVPSRWSQAEDLFLPPYRSVSFDAETKESDGLFVTSLSRRYKVSPVDAEVMCAEYLDYIKQELSENGTMDLGSIGVFVQENETDPLTFYPAPAGVASPGLYGLDALHMEPLSADQRQARRTSKRRSILPSVKSDERHITIRISRHLANYVAAAAASIILFFAFSTPVQNTDIRQPQAAESNLFLPAHLMPASTNAGTCASSDANYSKQSPELQQVEAPATASSAEASPSLQPKESYAVVLASQVSMKNAEAFVASLKAEGYNAEVYVRNEMVRVILPGFESAEAVHEQIRQMKARSHKYDKAWTLKIDNP